MQIDCYGFEASSQWFIGFCARVRGTPRVPYFGSLISAARIGCPSSASVCARLRTPATRLFEA